MGGAITLTFSSAEEAAKLHEAVSAFVEDEGISSKGAFALDLVLEEIVTNILNHGAGPGGATVTISVKREGDRLEGNVSDDAAPFDPLERGLPDTTSELEDRPIGGLGIHLVKEMTDQLTYAFRDGRNVLNFTIDLSGETP